MLNANLAARTPRAVGRMSRPEPLHATVVIACMVHLTAAIVMAPGVGAHRRAPESHGAKSDDKLTIVDVEGEPTLALTSTSTLASTPTSTPALPLPSTMTSTLRFTATFAPTSASTQAARPTSLEPRASATPVAVPETGENGDWSFSAAKDPALRNDVLGVTSRGIAANAPLLPSAASGVADERPRRGPYPLHVGGLVEGLDAHDRELGLGRGGPVLSAVEEAVRNPGETPPEGTAEYEVVVRRGGGVKVALLNSNDSRSSWEGIMKDIERGVAARTVRLPESAAGMRFVVHVDAVVQWPDGKRPAKVGTQPIATTGEVGSSVSHPGLDFTRVPMVGVYHSGKVCSVGAVVAPGTVMIGGACSPENIGQAAARIVHGRVVSESRL